MIFWTFQRHELYKELLDNGIIKPNFYTKNYKHTGSDLDTYKIITRIYNDKYNADKKETILGLIFGHVGNSDYPILNTKEDLYNMLDNEGMSCGVIFDKETHVLLKLNVPDDISIMTIDFYRFTDFMSYMEETKDINDINTRRCLNNLFEPNKTEGTWQCLQGHIPYIKKEWIEEVI